MAEEGCCPYSDVSLEMEKKNEKKSLKLANKFVNCKVAYC